LIELSPRAESRAALKRTQSRRWRDLLSPASDRAKRLECVRFTGALNRRQFEQKATEATKGEEAFFMFRPSFPSFASVKIKGKEGKAALKRAQSRRWRDIGSRVTLDRRLHFFCFLCNPGPVFT
jgi:hypothetical protein